MKKTLVIVLAVVALSATVLAQDPAAGGAAGGGRRGGGGGFGQGMRGGFGQDTSGLRLLSMAEVQAELKLSDAQIEKVKAMQTEMRDKMRPAGGGQPGGGGGRPDAATLKKMQEERAAMQAEYKKQVTAMLDDAQNKRLNELKIQQAGNEALTMSDVQDALDLSAGQKSKIKLAQREQQDAMQGLFQPGGDRQAMMQEMQNMRTEYLKKLGDILTPDQASKFKAMGGAPFKFPTPQRRQGGGGN